LHDPDSRTQGLTGIALVSTERKIYNNQCTFYTANDRSRVIDHLIERDRKGGLMAGHNVGGRVTDKNAIDQRSVNDPRHTVVIRSEHGDLLTTVLHLLKLMRRNFLDYFLLVY